jgi:hypothetical protein
MNLRIVELRVGSAALLALWMAFAASCGEGGAGPGGTGAMTVTVRATDNTVVGGVIVQSVGPATVEEVSGRLYTRPREGGQWIVVVGDGQQPLRFRISGADAAQLADLHLWAAVDTANRPVAINAGSVVLETAP